MAKIYKRIKDEHGKSKLIEMDMQSFRITSPTVFFLTGYKETDKNLASVAGSIKHLEQVIGLPTPQSEHVDIYGWSHTNEANALSMATYNLLPRHFCSRSSKLLAQSVILPLVADNIVLNEKGKLESATPVSHEQAIANLRNLTFFGYSAGTALGQQVYLASLKMMEKIGWSKEEAKELLKEIVLLTVGNMSRPTKEGGRFTTLYMAATNDRFVRGKTIIWPSAREMLAKFSKGLQIRPASENSAYISGHVRYDIGEWKEGRQPKRFQKLRAIFNTLTLRKFNHDLEHYTTDESEENSFAHIMQFALTNAIQRTERPKALALLNPVAPLAGTVKEPLGPTEKDLYERKILAAMNREWGF